MKILVCNDDGYDAPGIKILRRTLKAAGHKVFSIAPRVDKSGSGSAVSINKYLGWNKKENYLTVDATPLDCLRFGLTEFSPDMVIAGVNDGANIGRHPLTSGTVCLAAYAAEEGIPSAAISQHRGNFEVAKSILLSVIDKTLNKYALKSGQFLNINLPSTLVDKASYWDQKITSQIQGGIVCETTDISSNKEMLWFCIKSRWSEAHRYEKMLDAGVVLFQILGTFASGGGEMDHGQPRKTKNQKPKRSGHKR